MKAVLRVLVLGGVLLALTGCTSMAGRWNMETIKPETAKAGFQLGQFCLLKDGTYRMCVQKEGQMKCLTGTYKYDQGSKKLTFTNAEGKERTYKAELVGTDQMKVSGDEKGKEWTATMKRAPCNCPKDKSCCCAMSDNGKKCPAAAGTQNNNSKKAAPKKAQSRGNPNPGAFSPPKTAT